MNKKYSDQLTSEPKNLLVLQHPKRKDQNKIQESKQKEIIQTSEIKNTPIQENPGWKKPPVSEPLSIKVLEDKFQQGVSSSVEREKVYFILFYFIYLSFFFFLNKLAIPSTTWMARKY